MAKKTKTTDDTNQIADLDPPSYNYNNLPSKGDLTAFLLNDNDLGQYWKNVEAKFDTVQITGIPPRETYAPDPSIVGKVVDDFDDGVLPLSIEFNVGDRTTQPGLRRITLQIKVDSITYSLATNLKSHLKILP